MGWDGQEYVNKTEFLSDIKEYLKRRDCNTSGVIVDEPEFSIQVIGAKQLRARTWRGHLFAVSSHGNLTCVLVNWEVRAKVGWVKYIDTNSYPLYFGCPDRLLKQVNTTFLTDRGNEWVRDNHAHNNDRRKAATWLRETAALPAI